MFIFGHLGIGSRLASPWSRGLPLVPLLLGTLLPDLIDKPVYYGLKLIQSPLAGPGGLISCTRTFGHSGIFLVLLMLLAWAFRSKPLAAVALGAATHLLLDNVGDRLGAPGPSSAFMALVFPFGGKGFFEAKGFAAAPLQNLTEHIELLDSPYTFVTEAIGLALLSWDLWKRQHGAEIVQGVRGALRAFRKRPRLRRRTGDT